MIADLHVEYDYVVGSSKACAMPVCCRSDSGPAKDENDKAGIWGEYKCDMPERTLSNMLAFIRDEIKPDVAFWGGDSVGHNLWSITKEGNIEILQKIGTQVLDGLAGMKTYIALGNHDSYPQDSF